MLACDSLATVRLQSDDSVSAACQKRSKCWWLLFRTLALVCMASCASLVAFFLQGGNAVGGGVLSNPPARFPACAAHVFSVYQALATTRLVAFVYGHYWASHPCGLVCRRVSDGS